MIESEGIILKHSVYSLIDTTTKLSYISPHIVEKCKLRIEKIKTIWLVHLATDTKRKVTSQVK